MNAINHTEAQANIGTFTADKKAIAETLNVRCCIKLWPVRLWLAHW
jgi:hypothetical protein